VDESTRLRKEQEAAFHDRIRDSSLKDDPAEFERLTANRKFYRIDRKSRTFCEGWVIEQSRGGHLLDYGCGDAHYSFVAARNGGRATGIDISPVSIANIEQRARAEGLADRLEFLVMDAENLTFPDNTFDAVIITGVLHHLDVNRAYPELARVLKPGGKVLAIEALGHNPIIQAYRDRTPHLRTAWESQHIIRLKDIRAAKRYFERVRRRYFHLATLAAIPFLGTPVFGPVLSVLELVDEVLLRVPWLQVEAWMVAFELSAPRKQR